MFLRKKIGNTRHDRKGKFAKSDYKISKRADRWRAIIILEVAILLTLSVWSWCRIIDDLSAYYTPAISKVEVMRPEKENSIYQQICQASNGENCDILYNLAKCESSLNTQAYHINNNKTVDLGLYQWNSIHFDNLLTPACAVDLECSTKITNEQIKQGKLHIWVCSDKI